MYKPNREEYPEYYHTYISKITDEDILAVLERQNAELRELFSDIPMELETYRYEAGKWSIKEVLGHIVDGERIFSYRALRFARNDKTALPGFDQDEYVAHAHFDERSLYSLIEEFSALRNANILLFGSLTEEMLLCSGTANNKTISVRAILYVLAGHAQHHIQVIKDRYLPVGKGA